VFSAIYIEEEVRDQDRVKALLARFPDIPHIACERYGEVFNRKGQNFRIQKKSPALILAKKYGNLVLPSPDGYGFEGGKSFYFSHMLNCVYDCRYCFLQGMYRSANYVLFVNYEDFESQIVESIKVTEAAEGPSIYYSGYDCDSLALEPVSRFCDYFLPVFSRNSSAVLEIRTKSTQIRSLLEVDAFPNCVIAMSFTSREASQRYEHKVPSIEKRIEALQKLQQAGWSVALRFEPIIWNSELLDSYRELFNAVFGRIDIDSLHSVSIGEFRMPASYYKKLVKLYPDESLFARETQTENGLVALVDKENSLQELEQLLLGYIKSDQYYRCA
jgi:spore photoproduct lyase